MDKQIDETLNIGSEVKLAEGLSKNIKIGTIGLIRQVRKVMKDAPYKFSNSIGREKWPATDLGAEVDWPAIEASYREAFNLVLDGGLSDTEYELVDLNGIEELENLLTRFL
ncbi:hypothetical protein GCM10010912_17600 [Paenibacillus albidus]|uniref:Uncharacterized protein n=1 Tax=Paenibacillus albidus TaxID=2041023 RepID=A0A917C7N8_9BACL|nr:hypothetical protein [Paenibacillus albidus]GGF72881.1 hypothetical protein GCM10010912_17600 [Paenibacillus albidus]